MKDKKTVFNEQVFEKISKRTELISKLEFEVSNGSDVFLYDLTNNYNLNDVIFDEDSKEYFKIMQLNPDKETMRVINKYGEVDIIKYNPKGPLRSTKLEKKEEDPFEMNVSNGIKEEEINYVKVKKRQETESGRILVPSISNRMRAVTVDSSAEEIYIKNILEAWYEGHDISKLLKKKKFNEALYDQNAADLFFDAVLKQAKEDDEILLLEEGRDYLQSDLLKIVLHAKTGEHGAVIRNFSKTKRLKILTNELEFRFFKYNPEGELREEIRWENYF